MAKNRKNTFLLKRSNVAGKLPSPGDLLLGELALNTADAILYTSGTTADSILPIGWDRVHKTGDTMTGPLFAPEMSATTVSATTFYGDGSNLTGIDAAILVSSADTTSGYLEDKLTELSQGGIFLDKANAGGNESLGLRIGKHFKQTLSTGLVSGGVISTHVRTISSIQGDGGSPNTVTVTTTTPHNLSNGQFITVDGTTSYDEIGTNGEANLAITTASTTSFTYQTTAHTVTALESTGTISANALIDITELKGLIIDNSTEEPFITPLDLPAIYAHELTTTAATNDIVAIFIGINSGGTVTEDTVLPDDIVRRDEISLGVVARDEYNTVILNSNTPTNVITNPATQVHDLMEGIGAFNVSGNEISAYTGLTIQRSAGDIFRNGSGFRDNYQSPHNKFLASASPETFTYKLQSGVDLAFGVTQIDPNNYDLNGTLTAVPANKFTVQRIAIFADGTMELQPGQELFDSLADAVESTTAIKFVIPEDSEANVLLAYLALKVGTTDLTDTDFAEFIPVSKFGQVGARNAYRTQILNHGSTGLREGGNISADSPTTFKIAAGSGLIIDNTTDPHNPVLTEVVWEDLTGNTLTNLSGDVGTALMIDKLGDIIQFPLASPPSQTDKRDKILLGVVAHSDKATITSIYNGPLHITSPINQHEDLTSSIGPFSIRGNKVEGISGTLELQKSLGSSYFYGGNFQTDTTSPSVIPTPVLSGSSTPASPLVYATGAEVLGLSGYVVDVDNYDPDGLGVITPLAINKWTTHRIWHLPINNLLVFQYGQVEYNSLNLAINGLSSESFVLPPSLDIGAYLISVLVTEQGETDLTNATSTVFIQQNKFAGTGGGGGSIADTFQSVYLNSTKPQITTDATRGSVDFRVGSGSDSDNLVTFEQADGTTNAWINGLGDSSFNSVTATTISATTFYGDGSNLTGIISTDTYVTGATFTDNELTLTNSTGGTISTFIEDFTGLTVDGTVSATTYYGDGSNLIGITAENTETITAGENLVNGDLVFLHTDGKYWKADNVIETSASTTLRIALATIAADATGGALIKGVFTTTGLSTGSNYWLGTGGAFTTLRPTAHQSIVRYIGTALSTTELEFNPDETYVEVRVGSVSETITQPNLRSVSTSQAILLSDYTLKCTSPITLTLPTAVGIRGKIFNIKNSSSGTVTLEGDGSETIDGGLTAPILPPDSITVQSDGAGWIVI